MLILKFLYIVLCEQLIKSQIISTKVELFLDSLHFFLQTTGERSSFLLLVVNTESEYSFILEYAYNGKQSENAKLLSTKTFNYYNETIEGKEFEDLLQITDDNYTNLGDLQNIHYIVISDDYNFAIAEGSSFSFAFKPANEYYSPVHILKKENKIKRLQFSLYADRKSKEGELFFGDLPESKTKDKYPNFLKVSGKYHFWDIKCSQIILGDINDKSKTEDMYIVNQNIAYVSTSTKNIEIPEEDYNKIIEKYLKRYIDDNTCQKDSYGKEQIICPETIRNQLGKITFIIEGKAYEMDGTDLLYKFDKVYVFGIVKNINNNNWVLGVVFLWKYYSVFDYEGQRVILYSDKELQEYNNSTIIFSGAIKGIFISLIIIGVLGIGLVLANIIINLKNERQLSKMNNEVLI